MEIEVTPNKMPNHEQNHKNSNPSKKPNETSNNKPNNPTPNPKIRIPPIKISGVKEWSGLRDGLVKCAKQKPEFYTSGRYINVQTHTTTDYQTATKWLEDRHYAFHFKILDDEKCLRVVVRGLDRCITISEIQEDLENKGFEMSKIARLRNSRTMEELPLIQCADAFRMLTVAYGEATLDRSNVYRWYKMFSEGREDVDDEECADARALQQQTKKLMKWTK
ncbi:hypothetical protein LAZ67_4003984 [Cordylochernes scorpioides]|uniref:Uncharacterized protein n=1 Tax=Cordylochernes scorpioides TaxID=51811 RepID=A0ABY6KE63_9ARAC|nr:hypothetical protein LAZ67_4003984 [Cordylochernes scorpioides]